MKAIVADGAAITKYWIGGITTMTGIEVAVVAALAPFMPALAEAGKGVMSGLGSKIPEVVTSLWAKAKEAVSKKPGGQDILDELAKNPEDADALGALRLKLKKILEEEPARKNEFQALLEQASNEGINVIVTGDRAVGIGGSAYGSITTGDIYKTAEPEQTTKSE